MKVKLKVMLCFLFVVLVTACFTQVYAQTFNATIYYEGSYNYGIRKIRNTTQAKDNDLLEHEHITVFYDDASHSRAYYCVEPFHAVCCLLNNNGRNLGGRQADYTNLGTTNLSSATNGIFTDAMYEEAKYWAAFSYGYNGRNSLDYYAIAQVKIWQICRPGDSFNLEYLSNHADATGDFVDKTNEIQASINNFKREPSNKNLGTISYGREKVYTDDAYATGYAIASTTNCTARISGNKLYVTPNNMGDFSIKLTKNDGASSTPQSVYYEDNSQMLLMGGSISKSVTVYGKAVGTTISPVKNDSETGSVTQGDAKFDGAVYGIYENGIEMTRVTISNGRATSTYLPTGTYVVREITAPTGYKLNTKEYTVTTTLENLTPSVIVEDDVIKGTVKVTKYLGETELDSRILLQGATFRARLKSDLSKEYFATTDENGVATFNNLPYGTYVVDEYVTPNSAYKITDFENFVSEDSQTYPFTFTDDSKVMTISINKIIKLRDGEATDAVLNDAIFTVYLDADATQPYIDKNGEVVTIGPTDESGYAISKQMRTGTYYLKETTFPTGIDPDCEIEGEGVTYRNKVYIASYDNSTQGENPVDVHLTIKNEPKRNDIEIYKEVGETSNTSQFPLDQCEFTATLKSTIGTDHVFSRKCSAETTRDNGYCIIEDLPYGEYVVEETKVSPITLKCDNFTVFVEKDRKERTVSYQPKDGIFETTILDQNTQTEWVDSHGKLVDIPKVMQIKIRKIDANWDNSNAIDYMQGDSTLKGAIYRITRYDPETEDYTEAVYDITVDHQDEDGYWCAESKELLVGKYKVQEVIKSSEDGYDYSYAEGYLVDPQAYYFEVKPDEQQDRISYHIDVSKEEVIRGRVYIRKEDEDRSNVESQNDSDKNPAAGAVMRLTLDSNENIYYEVTLDENGYGEFLETNDATHKSTAAHDSIAYYPNTIPFGQYTITEREEGTATKRTNFYTQPEPISIEKQDELEFRIEMDVPVPVWLEIVKKDTDTQKVVKIPNGKYKIWDVAANRFVKMNVYPSNVLTEFTSNNEGKLILPEKLNPGEYIIYETIPPEGYYLEDEWRLPENPSDYGDATKGGKTIKIDKVVTGLDADAVNPGQVQVGEYQYSVDITDTHLRVNLTVEKKGEKLLNSTNGSATYTTTDDEEVKLSTTVPVYEVVGLANVEFELYANEDIVDANGDVKASAGDLVDSFTTNSEGIGQSRLDLYPGEYRLHEVSAPVGYVLADDRILLLNNENYLVKSQSTKTVVVDQRQKLNIDFEKTFEEPEFITGLEEKYAVFGVYVKENINNYNGTPTLFADDLVEIITLTGDNSVASLTADLPEGKYYVKELYAAFPYSINENTFEFELKYNGNEPIYKIANKVEIPNVIEYSTVLFVKVSKTSDDGLVMRGNKLETSNSLDEKVNKALDKLKEVGVDNLDSMKDLINKFYEENDIKVVPQATYEIWLNGKGTKKLSQIDENGQVVPATFTTNESGAFAIVGIPKGEYYLKELEAPVGYELNEEPTKFIISDTDVGATMYQVIQEEVTDSTLLHKTDIYTGEDVANCIFEIQDKNGKVLLHSITDDNGLAWIPQIMFENNETYYYIELDAPDVYKEDGKLYTLNTEPHEFVAKLDEEGKWIADKIEVENLRPLTDVELIKTDEEGNRVPNCKFELKSVEEGLFYEVGVTDEDGIYVFKNVPKGKYIYTELEAPEEYEIDTTPHEIDVKGDRMVIEFVNTGDIPVIALSIVALVSVAGIAYLIIKKNKASKIA